MLFLNCTCPTPVASYEGCLLVLSQEKVPKFRMFQQYRPEMPVTVLFYQVPFHQLRCHLYPDRTMNIASSFPLVGSFSKSPEMSVGMGKHIIENVK